MKPAALLSILALIASFTQTAWSAPACEDPASIRFAMVPQRTAETLLARYQPLFDHIARKTGKPVELIPSASYGAVIEGLLAGTIDLAELGPAAYAIAVHRGADIEPFASFARAGSSTPLQADFYHSLLVVRQDAGLRTLAQLQNKRLSLTDPASTSGALIPRQAVLRLTGQRLEEYFGTITFAGSHDRSIEVVQQRLADAAFVSHNALDEAIRRNTLKPGELSVLWRSPPIPIDPFVYRRKLCAPLVAKLRDTFLGDPEPLRGMFQNLKKSGFAPVDHTTFQAISELYASRP